MVVGQGAREHALAWALARSPHVEQVTVAPGNAGTLTEPQVRNLALATDQVDAIAKHAEAERLDLVVVGPEGPLVAGLVDRLDEAGVASIGPPSHLAVLEGSKIYCKRFCETHAIPTAPARIHARLEEALEDIASRQGPMVVKASGLCAGKGVVVAETRAEAEAAARTLFTLSAAREGILVESCLRGWETSYIVLANGTRYLAWPSAQDHKRLRSGNLGPNTGGMGAFSPSPGMTPALETRIRQTIIEPTLNALAEARTPYRGFLYAGIMVDASGVPHLLEFNCRLGDPETQALLFRLESDPYEMLDAAARGQLDSCKPRWKPEPALTVVLASPGYPGPCETGAPISGLDAPHEMGVKIFHAATRPGPAKPITDGGRVLSVTATGANLEAARQRAYARIRQIAFTGMQYREDIGLVSSP